MPRLPKSSTAKTGERVCSCGAVFVCGREAGHETCWCFEKSRLVPVPAADASCLCPSCLDKAIAEAQGAKADRK